MKAEDLVATRIGFEKVGETRLNAGRLVQEGEGPTWCRQRLWNSLTVFLSLDLNADESGTFLLGLNDAYSCAVGEEQIVRFSVAVPKREFANGNTGARVDVGIRAVLDNPARLLQQDVDCPSGELFWCWAHERASLPLRIEPLKSVLELERRVDGKQLLLYKLQGPFLN